MAMDQQIVQEVELLLRHVHPQGRPIVLGEDHPRQHVRQQEHPIVRPPVHPIAHRPGRRLVHQHQTILRLQWDQVVPGVVEAGDIVEAGVLVEVAVE
jgi:hypothetical protein